MGLSNHLTCLLRNLYAGQEAGQDIEKQTGSKSRKEYVKAVYCHPACLTHIQSTPCEIPAGWSKSWNQDYQEKYQYLRYTYDNTLMAESKEELKRLLMKAKEESEKVGLKLNIQKTKVMASGPITSWQIDGETMETVTDFIFLGCKITADGDCSHEIKNTCPLEEKLWQT